MSKLKEFTASTARPLPVILMADVSGSMSTNGKIDTLNAAVKDMLETFAREDDSRAEIHVGIVTFGQGGARVHQPLQPAARTQWQPMTASGGTPLGGALQVVTGLLEDRQQVPSRAYRPALVLVSDGQPTDAWEEPLKHLLGSERASKATRFALGIGEDADKGMLQSFLAQADARVFEAHEARQVRQFFRWVTMSVTARSRSSNPNSVAVVEPTALDELDF
ncbi:vWA domain-containing protein [Archangium violaceum]|uniref:Tellurite resistance protein TerY n=1 Tax=Archangium violaceum Cb vi76 TaxID=1406225 RepID=A0A084SPE1_9BACT|nr:VWA domain-containing protein [Archangium violaceum]KFA90326.1 tellurite resistance protein TerY [Archangium violaceum Cb vi76]